MFKFALGALAAAVLIASPAVARHSYGYRVHYSGGHHTGSHGGHYAGGHGSRHRGGHYRNVRTRNHYGCHRCR
jgi:hypothetical protein